MDFNLYFKSRQGELVNLLKKLVNLESPSADKKAVDACLAFLIQEFKKTGSKITRFPQKKTGDFYLIEYPGGDLRKKKEQVLVLVHADTVWPVGKIGKMPFYIMGHKVHGPGVLDMKAGLVMALFSLKTFHTLNIKPDKKIAIFINSAEEVGSEASYELIQKLANKSAYVICLEPALPGGALKLQRKGRLVVRLETKGRAAHGGTPEKGVSAIDELMLQLRRLGRIKKRETTVNIGLIGGGEKANVVPENAWAILDIRFWNNADKDIIISYFRQLKPLKKGARIKFAIESLSPPMEKSKESVALFLRAQEIASSLGMTLEAGKTSGGSDASIAAALGIPALDGLGPDGDGIHAENEHLILPSLIQRTALLTELLRQL
jgi:glutamate carboxypeptidase